MADFIHLHVPKNGLPLLSLIHVKASSSAIASRQISVSDYEIVCAQAIKNLRFLDRTNLSDRFEAGASRTVGALVWRDGVVLAGRAEMTKLLRKLGTNIVRRVVIVQPRLTQSEHDAVRKLQSDGHQGKRVARMRQLDSLLLSTQGDCRSLGAELVVIGTK